MAPVEFTNPPRSPLPPPPYFSASTTTTTTIAYNPTTTTTAPCPTNTSPSRTPPPRSPTLKPETNKNTDSIALSSALRLLILQRERAKRDIQILEQLRTEALDAPVEFMNALSLKSPPSPTSPTSSTSTSPSGVRLPKPQEIYKCPPIEWEKYRILPTPLERLHEEQKRLVPQQMQTGGVLGVGVEFGDTIAGGDGIQGRMRLFEGVGQRGGVVGR
ncbi:hypothetical protein L873DRAFT_1831863 [Choiromyces venosus 120613-1]|uniref:Uncharacterized protein n=1 Tax=Choiromyces venosus 120613-1 TaxID=1336337 RepID=A0A3N4J7R9_9PEZI|nr:hypothetical protein L873DRAFT_1831863 [Choiromyces venosus 120613-1]